MAGTGVCVAQGTCAQQGAGQVQKAHLQLLQQDSMGQGDRQGVFWHQRQ
jgi:hypothetical protein